MEVQNRKKIWLAVIAAAILAGAGFIYAGEESPPVPEVSGQEPRALPEPKGRQEIAGWQKAEETEAVKNPFSLLHETAEEERTAARVPEETPEKRILPSKALPEVKATKPAEISESSGEMASAPVLKGIMQGDTGRIALVQIAGQTASLFVGENFQDCTVLAIEESCIVIKYRGQERKLFLPGY